MGSIQIYRADKGAVEEFKGKIVEEFPEAQFILFGSKARNEDSEPSDIDILVTLKRKIVTAVEEDIFRIGFETGLKWEVVFGIVVEEDKFFFSSLAKTMPFYQNISKEGIKL